MWSVGRGHAPDGRGQAERRVDQGQGDAGRGTFEQDFHSATKSLVFVVLQVGRGVMVAIFSEKSLHFLVPGHHLFAQHSEDLGLTFEKLVLQDQLETGEVGAQAPGVCQDMETEQLCSDVEGRLLNNDPVSHPFETAAPVRAQRRPVRGRCAEDVGAGEISSPTVRAPGPPGMSEVGKLLLFEIGRQRKAFR